MQQSIQRFYRLHEVTTLVGLSRATIYRLIRQGAFPSGISLTGNRAVGWSESDLAHWMNSRLNNAQ
ncbi:MAG TPA: AlpA family phage regulatory protein [Halothiobacillus sp.]|nr:AlpA family phage regulatory protein [Halothiobacillus sp.]